MPQAGNLERALWGCVVHCMCAKKQTLWVCVSMLRMVPVRELGLERGQRVVICPILIHGGLTHSVYVSHFN